MQSFIFLLEVELLLFFLFFVGIISISQSPPTTMRNHQTSERKSASVLQKCSFSHFFSHNPIFLFIFYPFILCLFLSISLTSFFAFSFLVFHSTPPPSSLLPYSLSHSERLLFLAVVHKKPSSFPICIAMHFGEFPCLYFNNS